MITRRRFLAGLGGAAAAPYVLTSGALGAPPPSDRIVLAAIGVGGRGTGLLGIRHDRRCSLAAVCDVYKPHLASAQKLTGAPDAYADFRRIIDRGDIDAVMVATPDHWHALIAILACQSGKDVYTEKPLALTLAEGRAMVRAARRYARVVQMGTQHRCNPRLRQVCEWVRNGRIGKVGLARVWMSRNPSHGFVADSAPPPDLDWDLWLGPSPWVPYNPTRCPYNFRWYMAYAGGYMTDWGAHMFSVVSWALGADGTGPVTIEGTARRDPASMYDVPVEMSVRYEFADPPFAVTWEQPGDGGRGGPAFGMQFVGSEATVTEFFNSHTIDRGWVDPSPILPGETILYRAAEHQRNWLDCIATRERPIVDVEIGHRVTSWCHLGNIAWQLRRKLRWDPVAEQFLDDEEANRLLARPYRAPWHLPA